MTSLQVLRSAALGALTALTLTTALRAADHRDGPSISQDGALDLNDVYLFMDPNNNGVDDKLIVIVTFHGFIVPGEAVNEAFGDPNTRFHIDFYTTHVNGNAPAPGAPKKEVSKYLASIKPKRSIDVSFGPRTGGEDIANGAQGKEALEVPNEQEVYFQFTGFPAIKKTVKYFTLLDVPTLGTAERVPTAVSLIDTKFLAPLPLAGVEVFVGEADDPFFFDIPGFSGVIKSVREGAPSFATLNRGRDSFAGYNTMAIALSLPVDAIIDPLAGTKVGVQVLAQRKASEIAQKNGTQKGAGGYKTLDSMGNPAVNVALIPFTRKNEYNGATVKEVAGGKFVGNDQDPKTPFGVVDTLLALGTTVNNINTLAGLAVTPGDLLVLDTNVDNGGTGGGDIAGTGFATAGGGRRLRDDVVDTFLFVVTNGGVTPQTMVAPGGDNVRTNDKTFQDIFPFLAGTQQPQARGGAGVPAPDTQIEDNTRN